MLPGTKAVPLAEHHREIGTVVAAADMGLGTGGLDDDHFGGMPPLASSDRCSGRRPRMTGWPVRCRPAFARARDRVPSASRTLRRVVRVPSVPGRKFIAGEPMKPATNGVGRVVVELERRADLLDAAVAHHDDLVGHRHRLDLVVRDVDRGRLQPLVQFLDLGAHRHAQLGVEVGERLVEQEHLRVAHDRAAHRDALALAAGELARDSARAAR